MFQNWIYISLANGVLLLLILLFAFLSHRHYKSKLTQIQREIPLPNLKKAKELLGQKKERKEIISMAGLSLAELEILEKLN
jgi:hypothetical protein